MTVESGATADVLRPSRSVLQLARQAIRDFNLVSPGDRVAVGISGGKDSLLLAAVFRELQTHGDLDFTFELIHLDQNQPGFDHEGLAKAMSRVGLPLTVISRDTYSVVKALLKPGQIPCAVCGRLRRGILNKWCAEHGFNKLALGHHLDDAMETFFLNLLFGRKLDPLKAATPASEVPVTAIRPLILVEERKIVAWMAEHGAEAVECPVCDTFPESRRRDLKGLIGEFGGMYPDIHASVRAALYGAAH